MRILLGVFFVLLLMTIYSLHLNRYLSFETLKTYHETMQIFKEAHFFEASFALLCIYILVAGLSIPGAVFITMAAGYLFGIAWGSVLSVIGATIGACIVFAFVRYIFHDWLAARAGPWLVIFKQGIHHNLFRYLFTVRLIPLFPFWVVNIIPPLLGMHFRQYAIATFFGIIPDIVIFCSVGNGLNTVFEQNTTPNLSIIYDPSIFIPLVFLIILVISPILYHKVTKS